MRIKLLHVFFLVLSINCSILGQAVEGSLLGTWSNPNIFPSTAFNNVYNEVWGLAVNDREFAVIGTTFGTHIIDVTDPTDPVELFAIRGGTFSPQVSHRDFHDYKGYLYSIADQGSQTALQIIDISTLPDSITMVYNSQEYFTRSHNIFIDTAKARLYSLISNGDAFEYMPMRIFDISDPIDPQPILGLEKVDDLIIDQVHDAYVQNDTAYLNLGPSGFAIVDFADINDPNVISILESTEYPQAGYNHSGWLTQNGEYYYMADENFESDIKVLDLRSLPDIYVVNTFDADSDDISMPHNQIVHGDKLYVSFYFDGLQVYDISDPENPRREMYYATSTEIPIQGTYAGAWGVYPFLPSGNILVSDMQNGLFVIDGDVPTNTKEDPFANDAIQVYPNPSTGVFQINLSAFEGESISVNILDINGWSIRKYNTDQSVLSVDLGDIAEGVYSATIQSGKQIISKKLILIKE